jgi:hypothetical protein
MPVGRSLPALFAAILLALGFPPAGQAEAPPPIPAWLPHYDLDIDLDVAKHLAHVRMVATWTNPHPAPTPKLVFNAHSHYVVPDDQIGFMAKTLEILRVTPGDALGDKVPPLEVNQVFLVPGPSAKPGEAIPLRFGYEGDTKTTLVVDLPRPVAGGESVAVLLEMTMHLPNKQGRWGQWCGVTYLSNWLPVFAVYGEKPPPPPRPACGKHQSPPPPPEPPQPEGPCWQPTPFVPWHQPFFNEAAWYRVRATVPADQKVACTGTVRSCTALPGRRKLLDIEGLPVRDFALLCSSRYCEHTSTVEVAPGQPPVRVHVFAFPEHDFYAEQMLTIIHDALTAYSRWFGPYPYEDFTIAESYFGWLGNECSTLVMIDERVFGMPHLACGYVQYLVSHETCHQWWYNMVGTNGHCETWMDEGLATYFSHRLLNELVGRNNKFMKYPKCLDWLPNIRRDDYRSYGMYGTFGRGENGPIVQEMNGFGHIVNLFSMAYDKGSRVMGIIEDRLGDGAFIGFMRRVHTRYRYRILRVADFRRELEEYTGFSWEQFFAEWLYGSGLSDWAVAKVELEPPPQCRLVRWWQGAEKTPRRVRVWLEQRSDISEQTWLGIALPGHEGYPIRIFIDPYAPEHDLDDLPGRVVAHDPKHVLVEVELPCEPEQIAVDPDQILIDVDPSNNFWKPPVSFRVTPVYTFLDENDLTCAFDRWNIVAGPWVYGTAYYDAWYTRSTMFGARVGLYRTQEFDGGAYAAYRTDIRDVVAGVDGIWEHWPWPSTEVGFNAERRLTELYPGDPHASRGVIYGRYIQTYGSSLYMPPFQFVDGFATFQDNFLPFDKNPSPLGARPDRMETVGARYYLNYLTPYWDPEGGIWLDVTAQGGGAEFNHVSEGMGSIAGQFSAVHSLPDLSEGLAGDSLLSQTIGPLLHWLGDTRLAGRIYGATSLPSRGEFFTIGGSTLFRGFDQAIRQGSTAWVGSLEWRVPVAKGLVWDACDHIMSLRNIYGAFFYDVGDAYVQGHSVGPVAHGLGAGVRLDVTWFGFVERTTLRLDVSKAVNVDAPVQFWLGVGVPF